MSVQTGRSINKLASILIDSVVDSLVIDIPRPGSDRRITISQISYGCSGNAGTVPPAGNNDTYVGIAVLQNAEFRAGINYGTTFPGAVGVSGVGEYLFFDYTAIREGRTINFYPKALTFEPGANGLIVLSISAITVNATAYVSVYGDYERVPETQSIGNFKLR